MLLFIYSQGCVLELTHFEHLFCTSLFLVLIVRLLVFLSTPACWDKDDKDFLTLLAGFQMRCELCSPGLHSDYKKPTLPWKLWSSHLCPVIRFESDVDDIAGTLTGC